MTTTDELDKMLDQMQALIDSTPTEEIEQTTSLVDELFARIANIMSNESPPFMPNEREKFFKNQRMKILNTMFNLGRVFERARIESGDDSSAFDDFIQGLNMENGK